MIIWDCSPDGLLPEVTERLLQVARQYSERRGMPLRVVSACRSLREQAALMAAMSKEQLEGMYCRHGYPDYIRELLRLRERQSRVSPTEAYQVLCSRQEGYVSAHLSGAAVDVAATNLDVDLLKSLLTNAGFTVLDERALGLDCIHATYSGIALRIVRE